MASEELKKFLAEHADQANQMFGEFMMQRMKQEKADKVERYRHLNKMVKPGQILFVGSSLMEQFPIYELMLDYDIPLTIYNRGIGGFTTTELMEVMDVCVYDLKPSVIFINIGTNDLNGPDYKQEELIARYAKILDGIKEHLPQAKLYLLAYYPMCPAVGSKNPWMKNVLQYRSNARVNAASEAVAQLAKQYGAEFLNANAGIVDENGDMKAEYTIEGMHMYGDGYKQVLDILLPTLMALKV